MGEVNRDDGSKHDGILELEPKIMETHNILEASRGERDSDVENVEKLFKVLLPDMAEMLPETELVFHNDIWYTFKRIFNLLI